MTDISYRGHRFPPIVIQHAVWLYLRFTLSYRDVEELLAGRGLDVSYETVRSWVLKFGPIIAQRLRRSRPRPSNRWHLDEMVVRIAGKYMYLWRAVDHEGEVLEILVQRRRDKCAAVRLMRKLLRKQGFARKTVTTDKLRSYGAALQHLGFPATMTHCARSGSQVRNGLSGGGNLIRTSGSAREWLCSKSSGFDYLPETVRVSLKGSCRRQGTEVSNPLPLSI